MQCQTARFPFTTVSKDKEIPETTTNNSFSALLFELEGVDVFNVCDY